MTKFTFYWMVPFYGVKCVVPLIFSHKMIKTHKKFAPPRMNIITLKVKNSFQFSFYEGPIKTISIEMLTSFEQLIIKHL